MLQQCTSGCAKAGKLSEWQFPSVMWRSRRLACLFPCPSVLLNPDTLYQGVLAEKGRYTTYTQVCREANHSIELIIMERPEETREAGWLRGLAIAARPAAERPDAVLCLNDVIATDGLWWFYKPLLPTV